MEDIEKSKNLLRKLLKEPTTLYQLVVSMVALMLIVTGCVYVLRPFFPAIMLAVILTLATWPAFIWIQDKFKMSPSVAAYLMVTLLTLCFIAPVIIIGTSVADNYEEFSKSAQATLATPPEETAKTLKAVPYVGEYLEHFWNENFSSRERLGKWLKSISPGLTRYLFKLGWSIAYGLIDISLGVMIAWFLFRYGTVVVERVDRLVQKFGGEHGPRLISICEKTLIGVVYGMLGTALAQAAGLALGLWVAGVPGASFLGLLTFFASIVPIGPPLIWIPAALWLLSEGQMAWAIFLCIWGGLVIGSVDNVLKPYFISRGSNLPLLLVLLGILGGMIAFGFIGLFLGPTLLAVAYTLVMEWSAVKQIAVENFSKQTVEEPNKHRR